MLRYTTDRARPGLVALYDIRPGNGSGPFLQPQSPHGAGDEGASPSLDGGMDEGMDDPLKHATPSRVIVRNFVAVGQAV